MLLFFFLRFYLFIWQRERQREREHKQGEGRGKSRLPTEQGAWCGARSQDPEIMTQAEGSRLTKTEPPRCPLLLFFKNCRADPGTQVPTLHDQAPSKWQTGIFLLYCCCCFPELNRREFSPLSSECTMYFKTNFWIKLQQYKQIHGRR